MESFYNHRDRISENNCPISLTTKTVSLNYLLSSSEKGVSLWSHPFSKVSLLSQSLFSSPNKTSRAEEIGKNVFDLGSGCGSVGRAVASNSRDPRFESSLWQNVIDRLLSTGTEKTKNEASGQCYKHFSLVNYDSGIILTRKLPKLLR